MFWPLHFSFICGCFYELYAGGIAFVWYIKAPGGGQSGTRRSCSGKGTRPLYGGLLPSFSPWHCPAVVLPSRLRWHHTECCQRRHRQPKTTWLCSHPSRSPSDRSPSQRCSAVNGLPGKPWQSRRARQMVFAHLLQRHRMMAREPVHQQYFVHFHRFPLSGTWRCHKQAHQVEHPRILETLCLPICDCCDTEWLFTLVFMCLFTLFTWVFIIFFTRRQFF